MILRAHRATVIWFTALGDKGFCHVSHLHLLDLYTTRLSLTQYKMTLLPNRDGTGETRGDRIAFPLDSEIFYAIIV